MLIHRRPGQAPIVAGADVVADDALIGTFDGHGPDLPALAEGVGAEVDFEAVGAKDGSGVGAGAVGQTGDPSVGNVEGVDFPIAGSGAGGSDGGSK